MENGFFGKMFDLNRDGKLDVFEQALDIMAFQELVEGSEDEEEE